MSLSSAVFVALSVLGQMTSGNSPIHQPAYGAYESAVVPDGFSRPSGLSPSPFGILSGSPAPLTYGVAAAAAPGGTPLGGTETGAAAVAGSAARFPSRTPEGVYYTPGAAAYATPNASTYFLPGYTDAGSPGFTTTGAAESRAAGRLSLREFMVERPYHAVRILETIAERDGWSNAP